MSSKDFKGDLAAATVAEDEEPPCDDAARARELRPAAAQEGVVAVLADVDAPDDLAHDGLVDLERGYRQAASCHGGPDSVVSFQGSSTGRQTRSRVREGEEAAAGSILHARMHPHLRSCLRRWERRREM